jgi:hypothetical protein
VEKLLFISTFTAKINRLNCREKLFAFARLAKHVIQSFFCQKMYFCGRNAKRLRKGAVILPAE